MQNENKKQFIESLDSYCKENGLSKEYFLNQARSITEELSKERYVSRIYLEEKIRNIMQIFD